MSAAIRAGNNDSALQQNGSDAVPFNIGGAVRPIESVSCVQAAGGLTFGLNPTVLKFRSATLTDGVPTTTKINAAINVVLPSGGTLGAVTTVQARIVVAVMANGELAISNQSGGLQVDEENLISTTIINASSTANNVWYSTTARTSQPYRIIGIVDAVNTAGAWASPVFIQGMGGNALTAMSSLGYGQTWQDVQASRSLGTTYYNTTNKPIVIHVRMTSSASSEARIQINGMDFFGTGAPAGLGVVSNAIVPTGGSYVVTISAGTPSVIEWNELR